MSEKTVESQSASGGDTVEPFVKNTPELNVNKRIIESAEPSESVSMSSDSKKDDEIS